ncbi:MAG: hypothetical protein ACI8PD_000995 [Nitrospinales bacterium]|jgi:hypothetical protein
MKRFSLLIAVFFIFVAQNAMAHSGHKEESPSVPVAESSDPMYATEEKKPDPFGGSGLFSPSDLFMQGEVVTDKPAGNEAMKMEGSNNKNSDHKMPEVESAKIKAVETSSKGYGIAAGITLCAGLIFAGLTFIRPRE